MRRLWRRLFRRHPGHAVINVCGLALGIACCILILLYIRNELSYDRFHASGERIYRVAMNAFIPNAPPDRLAVSNWLEAPRFRETYPEVESLTRLARWTSSIERDGQHFFDDAFLFADSTFFDVFTFSLVEGDAAVLRAPFSIVITEETERKYFGSQSGLGETLTVADSLSFTVAGVVADVPENAHFTFDVLVSWATFEILEPLIDTYTYVRLREHVSPDAFEAKISNFIMHDESGEELRSGGVRVELELQPLTKIYLQSERNLEIGPTGDIRYVYMFGAISAFVLIIACINFMSLSTARSMERAREVGIRKVVGSSRKQLVRQFLGESILVAFLAVLVAIGIVGAALPLFNDLAGKDLVFGALMTPLAVMGLLGTAVLVGLAAGAYPAFVLSGFKPVVVLKGSFKSSRRGVRVRQGLVIFQFSVSIALIACTIGIFRQLQYMEDQDLGFDREQIIVLNAAGVPDQEMARGYETFKRELKSHSSITEVSASNVVPGRGSWVAIVSAEHLAEGDSRRMQVVVADHDFLRTMGIRLAAGRHLSQNLETDAEEAVLINEAAVQNLGWDDPEEALGREIRAVNRSWTIVGVMSDYHHQSLKQQIEPTIVCIMPSTFSYFSVRFGRSDAGDVLEHLESAWQRLFPAITFDAFYLDEDFNKQYRSERRLIGIFGTFAVLAILIACLGLFGLASFVTSQRTKEIGVRKVLGAGVPRLVGLLTREYVTLVLIALIIAAPAAYFAIDRWLGGFAYRIEADPGLIGISGMLVLLITLLTVSYHALSAALTDPVKTLKYE